MSKKLKPKKGEIFIGDKTQSKKTRRYRRRPNPLAKNHKMRQDAMYELGEQIVAIGLGNLILDFVYPRPDGPRLPHLSLSPIKGVDEK